MKKYLLPILYYCATHLAMGQLSPTVNPVLDQFGNLKTDPETVSDKMSGSVYFHDAWSPFRLVLANEIFGAKEFDYESVKLDLKNQRFEFLTDNGIKVLPTSKVNKFSWRDPARQVEETYINCRALTNVSVPLTGFCTIGGEGDVKLVKHISIEVIKADYNVAMDVGNRNDRYVRKIRLYILKGGQMEEINRRTVITLTKEKEKKVRKFISENHLKLTEEEDALRVINYYNSIDSIKQD